MKHKTLVLPLMLFGLIAALAATILVGSLFRAPSGSYSSIYSQLVTISAIQEYYNETHGSYLPSWNQFFFEHTGYSPSWLISDKCFVSRFKPDEGDCYQFELIQTRNGYQVYASPMSDARDNLYFYLDETGIIRWENDTPASKTSPPVGGGAEHK